ncbi:uncharacterized protein ASPGLDRAFT_856627 [Aspergillus glaucus CBS 516.65]|uniref:Uncharacterized protein n=1 Tax=Aspergillus glaucus CBS 516.65 TaxID=1160497 RepID=A0A1L9V9K0_ASPGL|nr:hypothetical protein ASPGLDRAFT_856627 [Aspergillus glaucus CBS 516.65]OJJ80598.1 hypothetical protein ASPGLDRAFT_856627 [Aspergillus glaucus CBS 516.65]
MLCCLRAYFSRTDVIERSIQALCKQPTKTIDNTEEAYQLHKSNQKLSRSQNQNYMCESLETLAQMTSRGIPPPSPTTHPPSSPTGQQRSQSVPPELRSLTTEVILILECSAGPVLFSFLLGDVTVP